MAGADHDHVVRPAEQVAEVGDESDAVDGRRGGAAADGGHLHVEGQGPTGHRGADGSQADQAEGATLESAQLRGVPRVRRLGDPRLGQLLLEGQHGGQHELGDGRRRRAPRAGEDPVAQHVEGEPVDAGAQDVDPPHPTGRGRRPWRRPVVGQGHQHVGRASPRSCRWRPDRRPAGSARRASSRNSPHRPQWTATVSPFTGPPRPSARPGRGPRPGGPPGTPGASSVSTNHPVGHMVRISTNEKPAPRCWASKARSEHLLGPGHVAGAVDRPAGHEGRTVELGQQRAEQDRPAVEDRVPSLEAGLGPLAEHGGGRHVAARSRRRPRCSA